MSIRKRKATPRNPMDSAYRLSMLSQARLARVGCVLLDAGGNTIGFGYNAPVSTERKNRLDRTLPYETATPDGTDPLTLPYVAHAEEAAILCAARHGHNTTGSRMYITMSPCYACARLIVLSGVKHVIYRHQWWDKEVLNFLESNGVKTQWEHT